jgi:glucose-6-phosphate 1-epimerase
MNTAIHTPGRVSFFDGQNEFPMIEVSTAWSRAEVYLHGAHVTQFQLKGQPNMLFMSQCSRFAPDQPIRGGIPICFPWFGPREGQTMHGFARLKDWTLKEVAPTPDGSVSVRFRLPECPEAGTLPAFTADYVVTVNQALNLELIVTNNSKDEPFNFENCLHTYFEVGDCTAISITGLKGAHYLDRVANFAEKQEENDAIRIASEVDRAYFNTEASVEIVDQRLGRRITVRKMGSKSTVVWNPWITKSTQMPDFGNEEYQRMVCVESGNVGVNSLSLAPGETSRLKVQLTSRPLA